MTPQHALGMNTLTKNVGFFMALALLSLGVHAAMAATPRISTLQFQQDPQNVAQLQTAIAKMRALSTADPMSADFRTSFAYWSNTHGYFGTGTHATNKQRWFAQRRPGCLQSLGQATCDQYYAHLTESQVPQDGFTDNIWGTCQHGNLNFLPWHRIFLYYYERIVRKYSGNPNFSLPYWNYYSEPNPALQGLALPTLLRGESAQPLYDQYRTPGLNANQSAIDPDDASATQAFSFADFRNFSNQLQNQPHGVMHCAVGQGCVIPDMGFVPVAGLDPVFYMHHANIDRLWQCWLNEKAQGQTIDLAWAKANLDMPDSWYDITYSFVDENGNHVQMSIADVFTPGKIDVQYDVTTNCAAPSGARTALAMTNATSSSLSAQAPVGHSQTVRLRGKAAQVALDPLPEPALRAASPLDPRTAQPGQSFLILQDVNLDGIPALTYKIYIASKADPTKQSYVATFNYFGVEAHGTQGSSTESSRISLGTLVYKVTAQLNELGIRSADQLVVRFVPTNLLSGALQELSAAQDTGVDIGQVRLETVPAR